MHQLDKVAQNRLLLQLSFLEKKFSVNHVYVWSRKNSNVVNSPCGDHGCVEAPSEGNTKEQAPKFLILEGKSSQ